MSKKPYRVRNWSDYNKSLVNRGSITFWFSEDATKQWHNVELTGKRGKPQKYSHVAIETLLLIKAVFKLDFRKLQGFAQSLQELMSLEINIPSYTQICRRQSKLSVVIGKCGNESIHVVVDSTGLKIFGEGEWKVRQHGYSKRRTWRKLHLGINEATGEIVASVLTTNDFKDSEVFDDVLSEITDPISCVSADGAYDCQDVYDSLDERNIQANIPPRHDAVIAQHGNCKEPPLTRDENIRAIKKLGRKQWKQIVGYHRRSLSETAMFRFKSLFGNTLANRIFEHQATEAFIKCLAMNKMTSLGMPDAVPC